MFSLGRRTHCALPGKKIKNLGGRTEGPRPLLTVPAVEKKICRTSTGSVTVTAVPSSSFRLMNKQLFRISLPPPPLSPVAVVAPSIKTHSASSWGDGCGRRRERKEKYLLHHSPVHPGGAEGANGGDRRGTLFGDVGISTQEEGEVKRERSKKAF